MPFPRWRRALLAAACASSVLLAACGGGDVVSQFQPSRLVAFGDAFTDAGQRGGAQYTINDGGANNWSQRLAARYGLSLRPVSAGGSSYAIGSARVATSVRLLSRLMAASIRRSASKRWGSRRLARVAARSRLGGA